MQRTTYPKSESVYQALDYANREYAFNAGRGSYEKARIATEIIDTTKKQIKELCHVAENSSDFYTVNYYCNKSNSARYRF